MTILIVRVGTTFDGLRARLGDYDAWFRRAMGLSEDEAPQVTPSEGEPLPESADGLAGIVVTGSAALVTDREPWSEQTGAWLTRQVEAGVPLLGVCYGHQLLAHALGGEVGHNPGGRQVGSVHVRLNDAGRHDPLLGVLPAEHVQQASHMQRVLTPPPGAVDLAETRLDPHHALRFGPRAWGVQFHPEFDDAIVRTYIDEREQSITQEGLDPDALRAAIEPSEQGTALLRRFRALCEDGFERA